MGGNVPVNAGATDPLDVSAVNSPAVQANPTEPGNLVVASRAASPPFGCALDVSFNGGATWAPSQVPLPAAKAIGCFGPDIAFGADGTLYLSFTSFAELGNQGTVPDGVWMATSSDGGRTLSTPRRVFDALAFHLRVTADPVAPKRIYLGWLQASETGPWGLSRTGNPIVVTSSNDGGATWRNPVRVSHPGRQRVVAPALAVGPRGQPLVAFLDVGEDRLDYSGAHEGRGGDPYPGPWALVVSRSTDGGTTWTETVVDPRVVPTQRFLMLYPPAPSMAVDRRHDRTYVAFHDGRMGDADIWLWRSDDGGRRWSPGRRVNDTARADGRAQYLPQIAIAPDGRLDVVYYDRRSDPDDIMNEVSLQTSLDGGKGFSGRLSLSDVAFDSRVGFGNNRGIADLGNRLGLVATNAGALAVWTDTRAGSQETGKQDLSRAVVAVTGPASDRDILRWGGRLLALMGLLVAARGLLAGLHRGKAEGGSVAGGDGHS